MRKHAILEPEPGTASEPLGFGIIQDQHRQTVAYLEIAKGVSHLALGAALGSARGGGGAAVAYPGSQWGPCPPLSA